MEILAPGNISEFVCDDILSIRSDGMGTVSGTVGFDVGTVTSSSGQQITIDLDVSLMKQARITSDQTNSTVILADITGLTFTADANTVYTFKFCLFTGCIGVGGIRYQLNAPTANTWCVQYLFGTASSATALRGEIIQTSNTESAQVYNDAILSTAYMEFSGVLNNGSNSGAVQLQFRPDIVLQTATIQIGSYMIAEKRQVI